MSDIVKFPPKKRGRGGSGGGTGDDAGPGPGLGKAVSIASIVRSQYLTTDVKRRKLKPALELAFRGNVLRPVLNSRSPAAVPEALRWLDVIPSADVLRAVGAEFERALTVPASPKEIAIVVAFAIDSWPTRQATVDASFIEAVEMMLADHDEVFSAVTIAAAFVDLLAREKFVPTIAEILAAAVSARRRFFGAASCIEHLIELRWSAEDVAFAAGKITRQEYGLPDDSEEVPF